MLNVIHNEKDKAIIAGIMPLPKGTQCPKQINPSTVFDLEEWIKGEPGMNVIFGEFGEKMQALIKKSEEYKVGVFGDKQNENDSPTFSPDDDIPF